MKKFAPALFGGCPYTRDAIASALFQRCHPSSGGEGVRRIYRIGVVPRYRNPAASQEGLVGQDMSQYHAVVNVNTVVDMAEGRGEESCRVKR